jgi:hypothetical protein
MKLFTTIALFINLTALSQSQFNGATFASDSTFNVFKSKLIDCFKDADFDFTDFVIDNNYFLVAKVLTLGEPKLYVTTFKGTAIVRKSKVLKNGI